MKCQVTLWGSNVSLNVEVACTAHGTLGFTDEDTARGIRAAHLDTGGAPVETGPGASPEPKCVDDGCLVLGHPRGHGVRADPEAHAFVYPMGKRLAWECDVEECGECGSLRTVAEAGNAARVHIYTEHRA